MKKTIIVLLVTVLCATTAFASVRIGVSAMANASVGKILPMVEEKDFQAIKEEALKDSEITARASLDFLNLDLGVEAGARLSDETVIPIVKVYGGVKVPVLKVLELGAGVGYRLEFGDGNYAKDLYWRFSGGVKLGSIWLEGIATLPIMDNEDIKDMFNFGAKAGSARLGVGLGIKL